MDRRKTKSLKLISQFYLKLGVQLEIPDIELHETDSFNNLKREIFMSLHTADKRSVSNSINKYLYHGTILLSLLSSPVSAYRVIRKGFYR